VCAGCVQVWARMSAQTGTQGEGGCGRQVWGCEVAVWWGAVQEREGLPAREGMCPCLVQVVCNLPLTPQ
jgi:hypothetical protein